jgi:hypothetical protein
VITVNKVVLVFGLFSNVLFACPEKVDAILDVYETALHPEIADILFRTEEHQTSLTVNSLLDIPVAVVANEPDRAQLVVDRSETTTNIRRSDNLPPDVNPGLNVDISARMVASTDATEQTQPGAVRVFMGGIEEQLGKIEQLGVTLNDRYRSSNVVGAEDEVTVRTRLYFESDGDEGIVVSDTLPMATLVTGESVDTANLGIVELDSTVIYDENGVPFRAHFVVVPKNTNAPP